MLLLRCIRVSKMNILCNDHEAIMSLTGGCSQVHNRRKASLRKTATKTKTGRPEQGSARKRNGAHKRCTVTCKCIVNRAGTIEDASQAEGLTVHANSTWVHTRQPCFTEDLLDFRRYWLRDVHDDQIRGV